MRHLAPALLAVLLAAPLAAAQEAPAGAPKKKLVVGTKVAEPFVIRNEDGSWTGISIELWKHIAGELGYEFEIRETDLNGLLEGLDQGSFDAVVAALTIKADREQRFDFTHAFYSTGTGILTRPTSGSAIGEMLKRLFSFRFLQALGALVGILLAVGVLLWFFERRKNPDEFGGPATRGIGEGFWWSAVTMTTVGYGDRSPKSWPGRMVALVWMFASIILISGFTAAIASSLTIDSLSSSIQSLDDLRYASHATVAGSATERDLRARGFAPRTYANIRECVKAVRTGEVEAAVYDRPLLQYLAREPDGQPVIVLPIVFGPQSYGIGLPTGSALREPINRSLVAFLATDDWPKLRASYLGEED